MFGYIYLIKNKTNQKQYIGKRYGNFDENYYGSGKLIKQAIQKYGLLNFDLEFLCECSSEEEINFKEKMFIETIKPEYNLAEGGSGGNTIKFLDEVEKNNIYEKRAKKLSQKWDSLSEQERQNWGNKISLSKKGKIPNRIGYKHSPETKEKIRKSNKKTHANRTEEHKQKILNSIKARAGIPTYEKYTNISIEGVVYKNTTEVMSVFNVSRQTVYNWIKKGKAICND